MNMKNHKFAAPGDDVPIELIKDGPKELRENPISFKVYDSLHNQT